MATEKANGLENEADSENGSITGNITGKKAAKNSGKENVKESSKETSKDSGKKSGGVPDKKADKKAELAKRENEIKSRKAANDKKPKKSVRKFFRDTKSEFKKVVWPTGKQVWSWTAVVLVTIVITAAAIFGLDSVFNQLLRLLLKMN